MDTWRNQEGLNKALNIYRTSMRSFIISRLKQIRGKNVEEVVMDSLESARQFERADEIDRILRQSNRKIESAIDINDFPHLVNKNWSDAFERTLNDDKTFRNQLWLIVECRNADWAHPPEGDAESESTRAHLFHIADVLSKINKIDAKGKVEAIRDELFPDTAERLEKAEKGLKDLESEKSETEQCLAIAESEKNAYAEKNAALSKQIDEKENQRKKLDKQLKRAKAQNEKYKKDIAGTKQRLEESEAAQAEYKNRLETTSKELKGTHAEWKATEKRLATALNQLAAAQAAGEDIAARFRAVQNLFIVAAVGAQKVQEVFQTVYPPIETDAAVRILDRRGVDKKNYLLALLEQKRPTIIYVQSEERIDQLLALVGPEKADVIGKCNGRTSEAEAAEIFGKLEKGELIAVVSNAAFSTLTSSHCVEHFVFCHLVPSLDEFFNQCEPAFTSVENAYLHLIYNKEQDVEGLNQWLTQKYPDEEALGELYRVLRRLAETDEGFIKPENIYSENICNKLGMAKLGVETGLAIFEELQFLERNERGVKVLPNPEKRDLGESKIHCGGEKLKLEIAETQAFQLKQQIEQIWEGLQEKLDVGSDQTLYEGDVDKADFRISEAEKDVQPIETVENDSEADDGDTETGQAPKPECPNAKGTVEQVREIRSRSTAGELNSELAEEDSEKKPEVKQSEFWQPIRDGEFGALFAGKPVRVRDDGWISKRIRGVEIILSFRKNRSYVSFLCTGENRIERRDKIIALFPEADYNYSPHESPQRAGFRFPVINKGKDHPEDWDEIRKKLVAMGTDIYNKIDESDL